EQQRDAGRYERSKREDEDDQRDRERECAGFREVVSVCGLDALLGAGIAELADGEAWVGTLRAGDRVEDRLDLVGCLGLVTADLKVDERGVSVPGDCAAADLLCRRQLRDRADHVVDRRDEGDVADPSGAALDQDALVRRLLEAGIEDLVHAARLARPRRGTDFLGADEAAEPEGHDDEGEPAEGRLLPVGRTPATHPGGEVGVVRLAGHVRCSFGSIAPTLRAGCSAVVGAEWESGSDSKTISAPTQVGGRPRWTARTRTGHAAAGPRPCPNRAPAGSRR